ncbi:hypothetical protein E1B28_003359 [Marasmius oreades]|uniref:Uncharacterized protein n=1 Tax=Marasmius oreades TaxID=181124 RepID=A0A9P7RMB2_9AGAR|nr:uncharacterized protein E1B28_003359 [Marasmius oreades]KAG7085821.1 hypothetical protein E1B28_003359 [Marasmius oreades]
MVCKSRSGLTRHSLAKHRPITPPPRASNDDPDFTYQRHPLLSGRPCDQQGNFLPGNAPPQPPPLPHPDNPEAWAPFEDRLTFDFAHYHFVQAQSSATEINKALDMWAAAVWKYGGDIPWSTARDMYSCIDKIRENAVPWKTYHLKYTGPRPPSPPRWMTETYELHFRDSRQLLKEQLANSHFEGKMNFSAYRQFNKDGKRVYSNVMSGDWAWMQSDKISKDPSTHGSMFVALVAGSDKTTVSVATGHQEYHPWYMSPSNITNAARRAHGPGVLPGGFIPIPKTSKKHRKTIEYQRFSRQLYHACLTLMYEPLRSGMERPEVLLCADGHYRKAVYGIGPYIADYPEQVWLSGIVSGWCPKGRCDAQPDNLDNTTHVHLRSRSIREFMVTVFDPGILWDDYGVRVDVVPFTHHFPRADIHEIMAPDLLHQLIKGTFKDHLVTWINEYIMATYPTPKALAIIQDIDRRISAVPAFPGLRRFPDGRDFNQWTGDDSKALMKVYIAAIVGYVPSDMVKALSAFMECCYIARKNSLTTDDLATFELHRSRFYMYRQIFVTTGVRDDTSLPRQHSLQHYPRSIRLFGSPNGLCSSITESKHIKAVKEPWRRSNRFNALRQMLQIISRGEKLQGLWAKLKKRGWMIGSTLFFTQMVQEEDFLDAMTVAMEEVEEMTDENIDLGPVSGSKATSSIKLAATRARGYPRRLQKLAQHVQQPLLPELVQRFLYDQLNPQSEVPLHRIPVEQLPVLSGKFSVYHSAVARFYAPSDLCGAGGMYSERIWSTPQWRCDGARRDTALVVLDDDKPGLQGMWVARVLLLFSFYFREEHYPCALVNWFEPYGDEPDDETGMWRVVPEKDERGRRTIEVIHLDAIARGVHLLPSYGASPLPENIHYSSSLDAFQSFFVNKFADHHLFEFISV